MGPKKASTPKNPKKSTTIKPAASKSKISRGMKIGGKAPSKEPKIVKPEASECKKTSRIMSCRGSMFAPSRSEIIMKTEALNSDISAIKKTASARASNKKSENAKPDASSSKKISGIMSCRGSMFAPSASEIMNTEASNSKVSGIQKTRGPRCVWLPEKPRRSHGTIFVPSTSGIKKTCGPQYVWLPRDPRLHGDIFASSISDIMNTGSSNSKISGIRKTGGTKTSSKKSKNAKPEASKSKKISGIMSCRGSMFAPSRSEIMNTKAPNSSVSEIKKTSGAKAPRKKSKNVKPETPESKKVVGVRKNPRRTARKI